ncbi:MAG: hypothetical protein HOE75_12905 [Chloroflexi bacterium]|nr:hypothetical protein [Chloroflexota bacterium]MBT4074574.1 hypothetical protein [Chloroflexota bacterium]MBT6683133.1 hypothetical protein [Chloroflexota bacterium]
MQTADITRVPSARQPVSDRLIEMAWLVGLVALPLLFTPRRILSFYSEPKYVLVHLLALLVIVAWAFEWAGAPQDRRIKSPWRWAGRRPERWAVIAGATFALAAVLSTLASPAPRVSLWGRDPLTAGYELYSFLAIITIFFAVALRLRTLQQASRVLLVLMIAGGITALYAIFQNFGWDPIPPGKYFVRAFSASRNYATLGNPIFFGSFILMSSIATIAVALQARRAKQTGLLVASTIILGIQLAGLWTSESRGPLFGTAVGMLAFGVIGAIWLDRRTFLTGMGVVAVGLAIDVVIGLFPERDGGDVTREIGDLGNIFDSDEATSIGNRATTRAGALELASTWERSPDESAFQQVIRPVVGLGPDMFFYSYPLSVDRDPTRSGQFFAHAHNFPLQVMLEMGLLGLGSFIALVLLVLYAAVLVLRKEKKAGRSGDLISIFMAVLLAILIGRATEQMAGVAQVTDLFIFWVLAGLIVALAGIALRSDGASPTTRCERPQPRTKQTGLSAQLPTAVAIVVLLAAIALFSLRDVRSVGASWIAAQGFDLLVNGQNQDGFEKYERAVDLNPEVEAFVLQVDFMIRGEAEVREDPTEKLMLNETSLSVLEKYEGRDPFAHATQRRMAKTELALGRLGQTERFEDVVERYVRLASEVRSFPTFQAIAADGIVAASDGMRGAGRANVAREYAELGLFYADRAIALDPAIARGWWVRGVALERLGLIDDAITSYLDAIKFGDGDIYGIAAHKGAARAYEQVGDLAASEEHRQLAEAADSAE